MVQVAAYHMAERSGFKMSPEDCWSAAESQMDLLFSLWQNQHKVQAVVDSALDAIVMFDHSGKITGWNPQAVKIFGWSAAEAVGKSIKSLIIPQGEQASSIDTLDDHLVNGTLPYLNKLIETGALNRDGNAFPVELTVTLVGDDPNFEYCAFVRDITERKRIADVQAARLRLMEYAGSHSLKELLVATLDEAGTLTESPIGFYHFLDKDQKTLSLQAWSTLTTQHYCKAAGEGSHYNIDQAGVWVECIRARRAIIHNDYASLPNKRGLPPGHAAVIREMVVPVFRNGLIVAILGVGNKATLYCDRDLETITLLADLAWDFAESKRANEELRESEERWKFAIEGSGDGVWDWNLLANEVRFSHRWKEMLGYADDEIGTTFDEWKDRVHPEDLAEAEAGVRSYLDGKATEFRLECRLRCKDDSWKWMLSRGMIVSRAPDGRPQRMIGTHTDITERKEAELQINFMAYHDRLTGLPNRSLFFDRLSQSISQARRNKKRVALLFMDLDGFKLVNDSFGHEAGDIVLKVVTERFLSSVRAMDTVARLGGDEFVVVLGELEDPNEAATVATKLLEAVAPAIELPENQACVVGVSIGISIYPDNGKEMDTLMLAADTAMYKSKSAGRNRFTFSGEGTPKEQSNDAWAHFEETHIVGIAEIDEQHQRLAEMINALNRAIKEDAANVELKVMFEALSQYTRFHFETEHELMVRHGYSRQSAHDKAHDRLLADVQHFKTRLYKGGDLFVLQSIKDWLLDHILAEDKALGEFIKQKSQS